MFFSEAASDDLKSFISAGKSDKLEYNDIVWTNKITFKKIMGCDILSAGQHFSACAGLFVCSRRFYAL